METVGNAYFAFVRYIQPRQWHSVEVVTSPFHHARTLYAFSKVLGSACAVHITDSEDHVSPATKTALAAREQRIMTFTRSIFDPIEDGDVASIRVALNALPGYSDTPHYTKEELLQVVGDAATLGNTYTVS